MEIQQIAKICHQVNKAYCESLGDNSQLDWDDSPTWQKQSAIQGVTFHISNETTPRDSHENWMAQKLNEGWKFGNKKDPDKKEHPCMVPYEDLPKEQQSKDYIFHAIVSCFKG